MRKFNTFAIIALAIALLIYGAFRVNADDKELFMGIDISDTIVKPNVVVLMDSSGSMNNIVFYPSYGVDGIKGTADDGYDPTVNYSGMVDRLDYSGTPADLNSNYYRDESLDTTGWYLRWTIQADRGKILTNAELENHGGMNFWTGCYGGDGTPNNFQVGSNSLHFRVGDKVYFKDTAAPYTAAEATLVRRYEKDGNNWFELSDIKGGPIEVNGGVFQQCPTGKNWVPKLVKLYGVIDYTNNEPAWCEMNYRNWVFLYATQSQLDAISHFTDYRTFDVNITPPPMLPEQPDNPQWTEWWESACVTPGHDRIKMAFTRIQAAREVICRVAELSNASVNLGLFRFDREDGGYLMDSITPSNDLASDLVAYKNMIWQIYADGGTPLAEALADVWRYYKPGPSGSKDFWPTSAVSSVHAIEYWCQSNYVIVMTDGESTSDRFTGDGRFDGSMFRTTPVKRTKEYVSFADWNPATDGWGDFDSNEASSGLPANYNTNGTYCPNKTCWYTTNGSDYLDDVAYFMRHQDLFPDALYGTDPIDGWPGDQKILTYTIGFGIDNDMLYETAVNGDGAYYVASNYDELIDAFQSVITGILLREFSFSAITAPKKTSTTTSDDVTISYVGYFMPSQSAPIWQGHLLAFELADKWGFDADGVDGITNDEYIYNSEVDCVNANGGTQVCERLLELNPAHKWDAAEKIPKNRNLYTVDTNDNNALITFNSTSKAKIQAMLGTDDVQTDSIIDTLRMPRLGDIFHSDVGYIGAPRKGKKYVPNINSLAEKAETYTEFYEKNKDRRKVLFTGTNDGILHMFNADDMVFADEREAGVEVWGFIPDAVHGSLKRIVVDKQHTYTVDGRLAAADICYSRGPNLPPTWSTSLFFGLRRGGNAYYSIDITNYPSKPVFNWKFEDSVYSGQSWGKPQVGKIRLKDPDDPIAYIDKWVVVLSGGFAFNEENSKDLKGKAVFMIDAGTGELLYLYGYHPDGDDDATDNRILTDNPLFNFPIAGCITMVDADHDGYSDTIYFGNLGGHFFKADISDVDAANWSVKNMFTHGISSSATSYITAFPVDATPNDESVTITVRNANSFVVGKRIRGLTSNTQGYITAISNRDITVWVDSKDPSNPLLPGKFLDGEDVATRTYSPIYHEPAIAYNQCFQLWVAFGSGDRDRPRTDPDAGQFVALRDNNSTNNTISSLNQLVWNNDTLIKEDVASTENGWYFLFPDAKEKMFDPAPIFLPDSERNPHIFFNTYTPAGDYGNINKIDNPCSIPSEGSMVLYDLKFTNCGLVDTVEGGKTEGRIAGGGVYGRGEYLMILGGASVGGVGQYNVKETTFGGVGNVLFWKEKQH